MFVVGTCRDVYAAVQHKVPSWPCSIPHRRNCYQSRYSTCGISISQSHRLKSFHAYKCHWSQDQRPVKELLCIRHIHIYIHNIFDKTQIFSLEPQLAQLFPQHCCGSTCTFACPIRQPHSSSRPCNCHMSHSGTMPLRCLTQKHTSLGKSMDLLVNAGDCPAFPLHILVQSSTWSVSQNLSVETLFWDDKDFRRRVLHIDIGSVAWAMGIWELILEEQQNTEEIRKSQPLSNPGNCLRNGVHGWQCWYVLTTLITSITSLNICETKTRQKMKLFWNCCMLHLLFLCSLHISVRCWWRRHLELSWADLNNLHRSKQNQASFLGHIRITVYTSCSGFKVAGFSTEYSWAVDRMCFMKMTVRDTQRCWKQLASKTTKAKRNDKKCILVELFKTQSVPYHGAIETTNLDTIGVLSSAYSAQSTSWKTWYTIGGCAVDSIAHIISYLSLLRVCLALAVTVHSPSWSKQISSSSSCLLPTLQATT